MLRKYKDTKITPRAIVFPLFTIVLLNIFDISDNYNE